MTGEVTDTSVASTASEVDFVALRPGQTIGRYTVVSVLGQGGFGITYRARDTQLDREVAIKEYLPTAIAVRQGGETVLPRSTKVAEDFTWGRERFVSEGRTLASLHHAPGIVRVFDFLEINGTAYIVMELIHGETLEERIKKQGPLDAAAIERILTPLLSGLEEVHKAGFLHRDIKPANILLNANGDPTLIDFGASRAAMAGRSVAMTAVFTPGYAAGEQMTSAKQGPWTDIYALSATLYHAITGKAPPNAFDRMLDDEYEPLGKAALRGFAPGLIAGIDSGLAVRASDRPQSIAGWRPLLSMVSADADDVTRHIPRSADPSATVVTRSPTVQPQLPPAHTPPTQTPPPETPPVAAPQSRTPLYAGIAAGVLLLAGGGGWLALSPSKPAPPPAPAQAASTLQDMKVEDLERVLTERRAADAAAAEKKRQEDEARRKADTEAAAKVAADADLAKAEAARKQAETELAKLKAEIETRRLEETQAQALARRAEAETAQRKAEAEMAALRQAEADARQKAAAEAEAKRQADEALARAQAERQKADEEAKVKAAAEAKEKAEASAKQVAEAEVKAKAEADARAKAEAEAKAAGETVAAAKKAAETAETGLRLAQTDRQRIQVALTSLGFDTRGSDGAFGPRSREMIAAWQKARNHPDTGFLSGTQHQALLREAAPALSKYDDDQKKVEEEKKKAEEAKRKAEDEAKARTAAAAPPPPAAAPAAAAPSPPTGFDGAYGGSVSVPGGTRPMTIRITGATGTGTFTSPTCGASQLTVRVSPTGDLAGDLMAFDNACSRVPSSISGRVANGQIQFNISGPGVRGSGTLTRGAAAPAAAAAAPAPTTAPPAVAGTAPPASVGGLADGTYTGTLSISVPGSTSVAQQVAVKVANGRGSGTVTHRACGTMPINLTVSPSGGVSGDLKFAYVQCGIFDAKATGRVDGGRIALEVIATTMNARGSVTLSRSGD